MALFCHIICPLPYEGLNGPRRSDQRKPGTECLASASSAPQRVPSNLANVRQIMWRFTPHSTSRLARQADTGLARHRAVPLDDFVAVLHTDQAAPDPTPAPAPVWDWSAANQRKIDAVRQAAPLTEILDDLDARIAELLARPTSLSWTDRRSHRKDWWL